MICAWFNGIIKSSVLFGTDCKIWRKLIGLEQTNEKIRKITFKHHESYSNGDYDLRCCQQHAKRLCDITLTLLVRSIRSINAKSLSNNHSTEQTSTHWLLSTFLVCILFSTTSKPIFLPQFFNKHTCWKNILIIQNDWNFNHFDGCIVHPLYPYCN